jgi:chemotaxis protein MotA
MAKVRGRRGLFGLDVASLLVAPLGLGVVVLAQRVSGLSLTSLLHLPAALVVFGGTLGAVLISYSPRDLLNACLAAWRAFAVDHENVDELAATLVGMSVRAHRHGLMSIEADVETLGDSFLRHGLTLAVDTTETDAVEEFLAAERLARDEAEEAPARVFEAAAGYAPTLGILGAVLGLIHVMQDLGAPASLGGGIATAFIATAYGVGVANLVLLPIAGRLRERASVSSRRRELIAQAINAIHKRTNPRLVAEGLRSRAVKLPRLDELTPAAAIPPQKGRRLARVVPSQQAS